jgi:hypothetical protein
MPDVLGLRALLWKEVPKEQAALSKLEAEVHMWARLRQTHGGGDEASEPLTGPKVAELQAAQSRQVIAAQQQQRVASQEEALAAWPTPPILEGRRTPPRASHVLCMVEGALGALDKAEEWKVPGTTAPRDHVQYNHNGRSTRIAPSAASRCASFVIDHVSLDGDGRAPHPTQAAQRRSPSIGPRTSRAPPSGGPSPSDPSSRDCRISVLEGLEGKDRRSERRPPGMPHPSGGQRADSFEGAPIYS